ncbi:MAG: fucose pyrophosphorylase domain-containing protein [Planctomycetota bacterium]
MQSKRWDYLILTAANRSQAKLYRQQLRIREELGFLSGFQQWMVVADPDGKRVGSGGSTICCLLEVLSAQQDVRDTDAWRASFGQLRILIVHGGGDSRRLPAYGPAGKVFVPLPCDSDGALGMTLFDRQLPIYAALPGPPPGRGQVIITSGDVLLRFDPAAVHFASAGITGLGCQAPPERAAHHGVYCCENAGTIRRFLQKPSVERQEQLGAINLFGKTILDIGVIEFDADTATRFLQMCDVGRDTDRHLGMSVEMRDAMMSHGLDFYREICCALGSETTWEEYLETVRDSGSRWPTELLSRFHQLASRLPSAVCVLDQCGFLHFGSTSEILSSGRRLVQERNRLGRDGACIHMNSRFSRDVPIPEADAWVEGCNVRETLSLSDRVVVVGVDVDEPLELPAGACLDVLPGHDRNGCSVYFVRCYRDEDPLHDTPAADVYLCGEPLSWWLEACGATDLEIWDRRLPTAQRTVWNAKLFPAEPRRDGYRHWLWMFQATQATSDQLRAWVEADRYSFEEMLWLADIQAFHDRRLDARAAEIRENLLYQFRHESAFSARDLSYVINRSGLAAEWVAAVISHARWQATHADRLDPREAFGVSRIVHTLASAVELQAHSDRPVTVHTLAEADALLASEDRAWLDEAGLRPCNAASVAAWVKRARDFAFSHLRAQIISGTKSHPMPHNALRPDEIVWARAPARLDLAGGWTDTPPYSLEHGGCVLNAAVELNGQSPIQAFARVISEPVIRVRSIDMGSQIELCHWDHLCQPDALSGQFSLVRAALAISGFERRATESLGEFLNHFGGGLELTTLAAIPKGSGLGTSSIMGSVLLATINRVLGRELSERELFYEVLRLEQKMTTGGGWQDQIGGLVHGVKLISSPPGMIPATTIRYFPADILDPGQNGGQTLLYYTGVTRLAKNILQQVVGRYLDRDREAMSVLHDLHDIAPRVGEAIAKKELAELGHLIGEVWELNKRLDPASSTGEIEGILARVRPWIHGAKLLGAGGGGFLLLVCRGTEEATCARRELNAHPPNERARFFDFSVNNRGLEVSVC